MNYEAIDTVLGQYESMKAGPALDFLIANRDILTMVSQNDSYWIVYRGDPRTNRTMIAVNPIALLGFALDF